MQMSLVRVCILHITFHALTFNNCNKMHVLLPIYLHFIYIYLPMSFSNHRPKLKLIIVDLSQCSPGWASVGDTCLRFTTYGRNGFWSRHRCLKEGGHLVTAPKLAQFQALYKYMDNFRHAKFDQYRHFVGIFPDINTYQWLWENGSTVKGEVLTAIKNKHVRNNCVVLRRVNGKWDLAAFGCSKERYFVCEKPAGKNISRIIKQNRIKPNTLLLLVNSKCTNRWIPIGSKCYNYYVKNTRINAASVCNRLQSSLAIIDSKDLVQSIGRQFDRFIPTGYETLYVGITYQGELRWSGGIPIDKRFWVAGHPSSIHTYNRDCAQLLLTSQGWRLAQVPCDSVANFICQRNDCKYCLHVM